jgi:hypothetical protein
MAVGVADDEAAHAPRFVGQWGRDLCSGGYGGRVAGVDVVHLNRDVGDDSSGLLVGEEADLDGGVG